jgi:uncharacterized protein
MVDFIELATAAEKAGEAFQRLLKTYEKLPETLCRCDSIGICCVSLPEMTALEALLWIGAIDQLPSDERISLLRKFVSFYLTNPVRRPGCPFLSEGSCSIYERRPFACRAYGLWSPKTGDEQTRQNRENQKSFVQMWEQFGVSIPVESLINEMDYCREVSTHASISISDDDLLSILEEVYLLSTPVAELQQSFENAYQSDFSFLIASLMLGQKKAFLGKYAVVKEIVNNGTQKRLDKFLKAVSPNAWPPDFPKIS